MATHVYPHPIAVNELALWQMGFDVSRLRFYRWLVENRRNPDVVGVRPFDPKPTVALHAS